EKQQGISFLIIMFSARNEFYYMRFSELKIYLDRVNDGHAKNFKYDELDKKYFIPSEAGVVVHYLRALMKDLEERRN
ncbi:MAG: Holliday junction resolvase RecU, partial [Lachnospiraceae bacterium]|nr:Holliday junction resolvase RecU [Lachnospiraceae bacterium]